MFPEIDDIPPRQYFPAGHKRHAELDPLPVLGLYVPGGH